MAFVWDQEANKWVERTEDELSELREEIEQPIAVGNDPRADFAYCPARAAVGMLTPNKALSKPKLPMFGGIGETVADVAMVTANAALGLGTDVLTLLVTLVIWVVLVT